MIQITPHMRVLVAVEPVDFRKGIDGLAAVCAAPAPAQPSHEINHSRAGHGAGNEHAGHAKGHGASGPRPDGDIFVALSANGGATFAPAVKAATVPGLMLGMRRGPRVAAHGDTVTITAVGAELVAFRSTDAGRTWSGPVTINDAPKSAHEGLHDLAAAPDGTLFSTWLDIRNGKMELWGAESRDGGRTRFCSAKAGSRSATERGGETLIVWQQDANLVFIHACRRPARWRAPNPPKADRPRSQASWPTLTSQNKRPRRRVLPPTRDLV